MRRAVTVKPAGSWNEDDAIATVTLSYDARHRRRVRLSDDNGAFFLLDLDRATRLFEGDGLALESGEIITVRAAPEAVLEIRGNDQATIARLAWHLGNRHVPLQVLKDGRLRILDDLVLAAMLAGLGADMVRRQAPFSPEPGAYHAHAAAVTGEATDAG